MPREPMTTDEALAALGRYASDEDRERAEAYVRRMAAVVEAARDLDAYERRADRVPGGGVVRRARLAAAIRDIDALDGGGR